jgi:hypothetical protein
MLMQPQRYGPFPYVPMNRVVYPNPADNSISAKTG